MAKSHICKHPKSDRNIKNIKANWVKKGGNNTLVVDTFKSL